MVENWAFENLQLTRETQIAGLPVRQFMSWDVNLDDISPQALATYDDSITLLAVNIFEPEPTNELTVHLYWQALEQTDSPMTVFVHLVGNINPETGSPLWAQDDHPPQNGRVSTNTWDTDMVYRDVYVLDLEDIPAGEYQLSIGLYDPITGERLPTEDNADSYIMGSMVIE